MRMLESNIRLHKVLYESYMSTTLQEFEEWDQERYLAFLGEEIYDGDFKRWNAPSPITLMARIEYYLDPDEFHSIVFTSKNREKLKRWYGEIQNRYEIAERERARRVQAARDRSISRLRM